MHATHWLISTQVEARRRPELLGCAGGGADALWRALRFRGSLPSTSLLPPDDNPSRARIAHRRAGWVAVVGSLLGFATASLVLAGMYARA